MLSTRRSTATRSSTTRRAAPEVSLMYMNATGEAIFTHDAHGRTANCDRFQPGAARRG